MSKRHKTETACRFILGKAPRSKHAVARAKRAISKHKKN